MINGADLVSFFITFGGGFIIGVFFGLMMAGAMAAADREEGNKHDE